MNHRIFPRHTLIPALYDQVREIGRTITIRSYISMIQMGIGDKEKFHVVNSLLITNCGLWLDLLLHPRPHSRVSGFWGLSVTPFVIHVGHFLRQAMSDPKSLRYPVIIFRVKFRHINST